MTNGLVRETAATRAAARQGNDQRRRYYRLTPFGRGVLTAEIERLGSLVREAAVHLRPVPRRT